MQEVFIESLLNAVLFSKVFQTFKAFCPFDAPFGSIFKKYRSFATVHYSLVATSAVFAELKQFKAIWPGNRHAHRHTHTHTHTLTDYSDPRYAPTHSEINYSYSIASVAIVRNVYTGFKSDINWHLSES